MVKLMAALSVSLGSLVVGFSSAYTSTALVSMAEPNSTIHVTEQEASWIGSLLPLSALIGGVAGGPLIETIGRKTTIVSTAIPFILSFLLISFAVNVPMVMAGRSVGGFCVGIASLVLPVYLGETVKPEVRGSLGIIPTILGNSGILICFFAGKYLDWSMLALFGAATPIPFLFTSLFIPETPRWYIAKNKPERARKALQWLRGGDSDVTRELTEIVQLAQEQEKEESKTALKELFTKKYRRPILISLGLMFFQQMSGINAVIFYTVSIFKDAGSTIDENLCTIVVGAVNLISTVLATLVIDRLGRKILLYMSSLSMFLTLMTLGTFFYYKNNGVDVSEYGWLPLASFVLFVIGFSIGFGPIPWLMMGEILPAKIRGSAASVVTGFNWSCTFLVTKTFTDVITLLGTNGAFWLFGTFCFVALIFVIVFVPETRGKSLEDIERNLTGGDKGPVRSQRRHSSIANLKVMPNSM